ncbi:hypothetical protein PIROE2DRAFT_56701 [Piromyces sp. E2]|nr:hypothetical protein PIROE2DRAFT_56701 [Piromyces sp. E2]|eukprot:OUM70657.1 hypothetical protein PIROE2DRAFT_56701 [Piromyces sp. E2]
MTSLVKSDVDDDIESLLKELELEQDTLPSPPKGYKNKSYNIKSDIPKYNYDKNSSNKKNTTTDELNDILQELSTIDAPTLPHNNKINSRPIDLYKSDKKEYNTNKKPLYTNTITVSPLNSKLSVNNNTHERTTSQHKAKNYVPNIEKLSKELIPKKGYTSICCQCTWYTINKTTPILYLKDKKIKWVCGGHYMN